MKSPFPPLNFNEIPTHQQPLTSSSKTGPSSNPAHLTADPTATIQTLFAQLFRGAVAYPSAVRFLSRYDKSATNIKESLIWISIGQCPWVDPDSAGLYHRYLAFPFQALETAARLGEYTLVDRGTWWGVEGWVREGMVVFVGLASYSLYRRWIYWVEYTQQSWVPWQLDPRFILLPSILHLTPTPHPQPSSLTPLPHPSSKATTPTPTPTPTPSSSTPRTPSSAHSENTKRPRTHSQTGWSATMAGRRS